MTCKRNDNQLDFKLLSHHYSSLWCVHVAVRKQVDSRAFSCKVWTDQIKLERNFSPHHKLMRGMCLNSLPQCCTVTLYWRQFRLSVFPVDGLFLSFSLFLCALCVAYLLVNSTSHPATTKEDEADSHLQKTPIANNTSEVVSTSKSNSYQTPCLSHACIPTLIM